MGSELFLAFFYCFVFLAVLMIGELAVRQFGLSSSLSRRLVHVGAGLFGIFMWYYFSQPVFLICVVLLILFISVSYAKRLLRSVHDVERKTYGEIYLPIGVLSVYIIASDIPEVFIASVLVMAIADAVAGVIGDLRKQGRPSKLGSVGFFIAASVILLACGSSYYDAAVIAFVATAVERVSSYGTDNATVPITVAILLLL